MGDKKLASITLRRNDKRKCLEVVCVANDGTTIRNEPFHGHNAHLRASCRVGEIAKYEGLWQ